MVRNTIKYNTRKKKGGVYIAQGTYGCVFGKPPLKCIGDAKRLEDDVISKLMNKKEAATEYSESEKWRAIDPSQEFSLFAFKMCTLDKEDIKQSNQTHRCIPFIRPSKGDIRDTLLFYKNGGPDLSELKVHAKNYKPLFKAIAPLIEGLAIAHKHNLVHFDIKPQNILAEFKKDKIHLRFIDFGLSLDTSKVKAIDDIYTGTYNYWPFELKAYDENYGDIIDKKFIEIELERFNKGKYEHSTGISMPLTMIDANSAYSIFKRYNFSDYKSSLPKVDVYSIGVLLNALLSIYFSYYITDEGDYYKLHYYDAISERLVRIEDLATKTQLTKPQIEFHKTLYYNLLVPLVKFIRKCTEFDPLERYTSQQAAEEYKKLLPLFDTYLDASSIRMGLANQQILNESPDIPYIKTPDTDNPDDPRGIEPPQQQNKSQEEHPQLPRNNENMLNRIMKNLEGLEEEITFNTSPSTRSRSRPHSRKRSINALENNFKKIALNKNTTKKNIPHHPMVLRPRKK